MWKQLVLAPWHDVCQEVELLDETGSHFLFVWVTAMCCLLVPQSSPEYD